MLPALKEQGNKLKEQLEKERQECREIEMNIESMNGGGQNTDPQSMDYPNGLP